jgi:hypothetical protein
MALVITLIMLAVTLVMAVAFLAIARRERNAVSTTTDTTVARLATDAALAAAQAQIAANILATTNLGAYNYSLLVSTNYQNAFGFVSGIANPTNVNYDYRSDAGNPPLNAADLVQNIANLWLLPRAPVFVYNRNTGLNDFRFYLDLNRNGQFETNNPAYTTPGDPEWIGVLERPDQPHSANNHFLARYAFLAQPIGNSLDLNYIHDQSKRLGAASDGFFRNQGVGSWELNLAAFLTDLNTNQWDTLVNPYFYNANTAQSSVGTSFEDALALLRYRYGGSYANLASVKNSFLNTANYPFNIDGYSDGPLQTTVNTNAGFPSDPIALPWSGADNTNRFFNLVSDLFDSTKTATGVSPVAVAAGNYFSGHLAAAGNSTNFYDRYTFYRLLDELGTESTADSGKLNLNYSNAVVSYNNLGVVTNIAIIPGAETNLVPWAATNFFHAAADRLLRAYTTNWFAAGPSNYLATYYNLPYNAGYYAYIDSLGRTNAYSPTGLGLTNQPFFGMTNQIPAFGVGNIPVFVNSNFVYAPAVNRLLQLAANIYDASTNSFYPSVFRPIFEHDNSGNVFIVGYVNISSGGVPNTVSGSTDPQLAIPHDVSDLLALSANYTPIMDVNGYVNVYGVPWIIGAKKNLPGLNQFSLVNSAQVTRKLQIARLSVGGPFWTNHLYLMSITNNLGVSFWNSYANNYPTNYPGPLNLSAYVSDTVQMVLTNSDSATIRNLSFTTNFIFTPAVWPGSHWLAGGGGSPAAGSFMVTNWVNTFLPVEVYKTGLKNFAFVTDSDIWETNNHSSDPLPQFGLMTTNRFRAIIVDNTHVIDYVQLRDPIDSARLSSDINDPNYADVTGTYYLWSTNAWGLDAPPSWGIVNQIDISSIDETPPASAQWKDPAVAIPGVSDTKKASRVYFGAILKTNSVYQYKADNGTINNFYTNLELVVQAPYTAARTIFVPYLYQVNDPLVHYLASDLNAGIAGTWSGNNVMANGVWEQDNGIPAATFPMAPSVSNPGIINGLSRYQPWGQSVPNTLLTSSYDFSNPYNSIYKDPLAWSSDYWDFPTNQYPSVGWLGRVHRGTPWQTVYLKASDILKGPKGPATWAQWTGDAQYYDAANSVPVQDWQLFDLFTTRFNDNAAHGTLSVNQPDLAAWSAVFGGMVALANRVPAAARTAPPIYGWTNIQPAGVNGNSSSLGYLVTNINNSRSVFVNADGLVGTFEHKGDILSVAALTERSPFLNWTNVSQQKYGISDEVYEWLPQQALGLLRASGTTRYVVYCYGQTLRPAANSLVTAGGQFFGLCTNYQITAESAARAVIRVDRQVTTTGTNYSTVVESFNPLPPQ